MSRIFLVYEDYADLMSVEATLKRVGFDVLGVTSEYSMADQMLGFNPDLVVGFGVGGKVTTLGVGKRLREMTRWQGKVILIFPQQLKPQPADLMKIRVDMILESPVANVRLIQVIGRILGHDEAVLLERLNKSMPSEQGGIGSSSDSSSSLTDEEAIYVRGQSPEEGDDVFSASDQNERQKVEFKFGERMTSADSLKGPEAEEQEFPDVDLQSLERELLGGGTPESERIEEAPANEPPVGAVQGEGDAEEQLRKAEEGLKAKMQRYSEMTQNVKIAPKSTIRRVEARRRQRELVEDWDKKTVSEIDQLRREFTKALFKK